MSQGDFWSKRRAAVAEEERAGDAAHAAALEAEEIDALESREDDAILEELNLADPDTLDTPEAIRDFLKHTLPARLKSRALRRLWRLNPVLANLDGLVDYGEDYTDSATVVENLQTAYQVGKGMMRHVEELARQAEAAAEAESVDDPDAVEPEPVENEVPVAEGDTVEEASEITALENEVGESAFSDDALEPLIPPRPRRMSFRFEDQGTGP